jgi:hypothetical protein
MANGTGLVTGARKKFSGHCRAPHGYGAGTAYLPGGAVRKEAIRSR